MFIIPLFSDGLMGIFRSQLIWGSDLVGQGIVFLKYYIKE